jgi:hypothetical protein
MALGTSIRARFEGGSAIAGPSMAMKTTINFDLAKSYNPKLAQMLISIPI